VGGLKPPAFFLAFHAKTAERGCRGRRER